MKRPSLLCLIVLILLLCRVTGAQTHYADKNYYLIDSLDLSKLSKGDIHLIDSCLKVYHTATEDTTRLKSLTNLASDLSDTKTWYAYAQICRNEVLNALSRKKLAPVVQKRLYKIAGAVNSYIGYYYVNILQNDSASEEYYISSINYYKMGGVKRSIANTMASLGIAYETQGKIKQAMKLYQEALGIQEEIKDTADISQSYQYIGNLLRNQNDYRGALNYLGKSISLLKKTKNWSQVANSLNLTGICYKNLNLFDSAMYAYKSALKIDDSLHNEFGIATELLNEGVIYQNKGNLDTALDYYQQSLKKFEPIGNKNAIGFALTSITVIDLEKKNYKGALEVGQRNMKLSREIGYPENIMNAAQTLCEAYKGMGQYKEALAMEELYKKMSDSILNATTKRSSIEQDLKYQHDKELMKVKQQQEKATLAAQKEREKRNIIIEFISGVLFLVLIFLGFLYTRFRLIRKQKNIIERQKAEAEKKNVLIEQQKQLVEEQKNIVEEKNKDILDSITYAKRLQDAILPPISEIKKRLPDSFILFKPKDIVAGDFYWMETSKKNILIAAADCTGHGVPGAMISVVCSNALNRTVKEFGITEPGKILDKTRELVIETFEKSEGDIKDGMDISLCSINTDDRVIQWAGAYNPLLYTHDKELKELIPDKQPVGKHDRQTSFTTHIIHLSKGDMLYLFTDGYADQFGGPGGKKFKTKHLHELCTQIAHLETDEQIKVLEKTFEDWKGRLEQVDDVLVIGITL